MSGTIWTRAGCAWPICLGAQPSTGAVKLSRLHTPITGTRSLDVLHIASALELNARHFVTYDHRQAKLATLCGLKVIKPQLG